MPKPHVLISSTVYDLHPYREQLAQFVEKRYGFEASISERGDIFYDPDEHTHVSCVEEVKFCQILILLIGGRYGGTMYNDGRISVTHAEYNEAFKRKLKIFSLVDKKVWAFHDYYTKLMKTEPRPDLASLPSFPGVSNLKVFDFIDTVRKKDRNNGMGFFDSFSDIEAYLTKQWAGLFFKLLTSDIEDNSKKEKENYALTGNLVTSNLNAEFKKHRYNQ